MALKKFAFKVLNTDKYEIYEKDEHIPYGGNQMFFGDD